MAQQVYLIFDVGKTNKKYFLFDENFLQVRTGFFQVTETVDDDGFPCDDLDAIEDWMLSVYHAFKVDALYEIKYINISSYGATWVHIDEAGKPCTPLYNYLRDFPQDVMHKFEALHGSIEEWSKQTCSPSLGMLNAGLQLFWLKHWKPEVFKRIRYSVFLPQYLSYRFSNKLVTEYTSLGCHTGVWDFKKNSFHQWMYDEELTHLLPPLCSTNQTYTVPGTVTRCGVGIHDSSAALLPYLRQASASFVLLSTGTWSIALNPFNAEVLTLQDLQDDCLCYLQPQGNSVKASRLFLGSTFSKWVKRLDVFFDVTSAFHTTIPFDYQCYRSCETAQTVYFDDEKLLFTSFSNYETAYHQLLYELLKQQVEKLGLAIGNTNIDIIYVDGGFSTNEVFIEMLRCMMPAFKIVPSQMALGTALGAAMIVEVPSKTECLK